MTRFQLTPTDQLTLVVGDDTAQHSALVSSARHLLATSSITAVGALGGKLDSINTWHLCRQRSAPT